MEKAAVSDKNTKAQILEAYERLVKEVEERSGDNPKEVQQRKQETEIVQKVQGSSEKSISEQIAKIKTDFVSSLEKIEVTLTTERRKLSEIQEAITIEEKHLKDLYGLTANADALSAILLAQKEQKEQFEREMSAQTEAFTVQTEETRARWAKEKAVYDENLKAEKENTAKLRKRDEEEYAYATAQKRKQEQDEYAQKKSRQDADLKEQKAAFEKEFAEREKNIKESENELNALRAGVEQFEFKLNEAVANAQSETEARITLTHKYETELREKEIQGILALKDHQIKTLESKIKEMETQLKEAASKVDTSEKTVKDIALKAIENSVKTQVVERERTKE